MTQTEKQPILSNISVDTLNLICSDCYKIEHTSNNHLQNTHKLKKHKYLDLVDPLLNLKCAAYI